MPRSIAIVTGASQGIGRATARSRRPRPGGPGEAGIARNGEPEEIAELMAFLVSPAVRCMTRSMLRRDGGEVKSIRRADREVSCSPGGMMLALEVVPLPVTDVDRALAFYTERAGFTLDVDYRPTAEFRVVQLTPAGSSCSVQLVTADSPRRVRNLVLVTTDLAAERAKLIARGVAVGEVRHKEPVETWAGAYGPGLDPQRRDYASFADFADPDGNTWILQERGYRGSGAR